MSIESRGLVRSRGLEGCPQVAGGVAARPLLLPAACWELCCWSQLQGPQFHPDTISQNWKENQERYIEPWRQRCQGCRLRVIRGFWRKEDSIGHREMKAHGTEKQEGRQILELHERWWSRKGGWRRARQAPPSPSSPPLLQHTNSGFWTQELGEHLPCCWRAGAMSHPHHH